MHIFFLQVSTNGFISLEKKFVIDSFFVERLPRTHTELFSLIAPLWADLNFRQGGSLYYRVTEDKDFLGTLVERIRAKNVAYEEYEPALALVATWFQSRISGGNITVRSNNCRSQHDIPVCFLSSPSKLFWPPMEAFPLPFSFMTILKK